MLKFKRLYFLISQYIATRLIIIVPVYRIKAVFSRENKLDKAFFNIKIQNTRINHHGAFRQNLVSSGRQQK